MTGKPRYRLIKAKNTPLKIGLLGILMIFGFLYSNLALADFICQGVAYTDIMIRYRSDLDRYEVNCFNEEDINIGTSPNHANSIIKYGDFWLKSTDTEQYEIDRNIDINPKLRRCWHSTELDPFDLPSTCDKLAWSTADNFYLNSFLEGLNEYKFITFSSQTILDYEGNVIYSSDMVEKELRISGQDPISGTTITNLDDILTIEYQDFDWDILDGFIVNFKQDKTNIAAQSIKFKEDDLEPSGTGTIEVSLADFNITTNKIWHLTGFGYDERGYCTLDLITPAYHLNFNVEGLPNPIIFTDPLDWYSENVERFSEPTALFSAFISVFNPIFEPISNFGEQMKAMFKTDEAYERGFSLGGFLPQVEEYVKKIDIFFGGFPLINFFKYLLLILLGIFVIKLIMKFIPFFG